MALEYTEEKPFVFFQGFHVSEPFLHPRGSAFP